MNSEGIGLGLTIVKQIVQSCQGKISVESEGVGKGSTFTFSMNMQAIFEDPDLERQNIQLEESKIDLSTD